MISELKNALKRVATVASMLLLGALVPVASLAESRCEGSGALLVRDVRVLDLAGEAPATSDHMNVLIRDGAVVAIGPDSGAQAPDDVCHLDGRGRTLMPGLVDMHVHIWDEAELGAYIGHGVTTVRNLSGMPFLLEMRDRVATGELLGPRIVTSGPILNGPGPNAQINHQIVETAEEARAAVRAQHAAGYRRLKVYSNLSREAYEAIRDEAETLGMPITGHTPEGVREPGMPFERPFNIAFEELLDDGFETIEHVESIVWHGLRERYDEEAARALAHRIAEAGVPVDPTLIAFANLYRTAESRGAYLERPGTNMLNPFISAMEEPMFERWRSEDADRAREQLAFFSRFTAQLQQEGAMLVAGSDSGIFTNIPGASLHDELALLVEAGLTPYQALRAATYNAAVVLGEAETVGRVAPGYRADLILVAGDPLADIGLVREPAAVIANGNLLTAGGIAIMLESAEQPSAERTQRNVLAAMAAQGSEVPAE
ncbi:amidohydrolase family protein [Parasphingopyxis marina]|uniref:Amidohydrolase family protein n=1 Tax=Parasphingopyxis marina TaxID=2761622 RepID=A0A842I1S2_9SPHN|nr:amidohydrolase family protein [Parasphingopyxis marina]MBC2777714.1 amidohydrolase family protein [Parasphingopyxis marina]